jgi:hypothetical protein
MAPQDVLDFEERLFGSHQLTHHVDDPLHLEHAIELMGNEPLSVIAPHVRSVAHQVILGCHCSSALNGEKYLYNYFL